MNLLSTPQPCKVHTLKVHREEWKDGVKLTERRIEKIFSYSGTLIGWGQEADGDEHCICGLVQKEDGSFETPAASTITVDTPTLVVGENIHSEAVMCMAGILRAVNANHSIRIVSVAGQYNVKIAPMDTFTPQAEHVFQDHSLVKALLTMADKFSEQ